MRYFCTFLIIFLSACSPAPVQRAPANSLSEADELAYRDDLTPKEKRQLLLSTPYIIEPVIITIINAVITTSTKVNPDSIFSISKILLFQKSLDCQPHILHLLYQ